MEETTKSRHISTKFYGLIISAIILALGTGYGLSLVGQGLEARAGNSVTVTGQSRTNAVADNAVWTLNVQESSPNVAAAVTKVEKSVAALSSYLTTGEFQHQELKLVESTQMLLMNI